MKRLSEYVRRSWQMLSFYISPVFFLMLILSASLWYIVKLSYTYTTVIPVDITVENNEFRVYCLMQGSGYKLFAQKYFYPDLEIPLQELEYSKSIETTGAYDLDRTSLQNAISTRRSDIRIISIDQIPEINLEE